MTLLCTDFSKPLIARESRNQIRTKRKGEQSAINSFVHPKRRSFEISTCQSNIYIWRPSVQEIQITWSTNFSMIYALSRFFSVYNIFSSTSKLKSLSSRRSAPSRRSSFHQELIEGDPRGTERKGKTVHRRIKTIWNVSSPTQFEPNLNDTKTWYAHVCF